MSTRTNIVISKTVGKQVKYQQLYHHHDGYPSGVGHDLQDYMNGIMNMDETLRKGYLKTPRALALYLNDNDESYRLEKDLGLHGDIEYFYNIDLDQEKIYCYAVYMWGDTSSFEDFVNGTADKIISSEFTDSKYYEQFQVYGAAFEKTFSDDEWSELDEITNETNSDNVSLDEDDLDFENWEVSDLLQFVTEDGSTADILAIAEGYMNKHDFKDFLIKVSEAIVGNAGRDC